MKHAAARCPRTSRFYRRMFRDGGHEVSAADRPICEDEDKLGTPRREVFYSIRAFRLVEKTGPG